MTIIGEAFIAIKPTGTQTFGKTVEQQITPGLRKTAASITAILGGAVIARKALQFGKASIDEARESINLGRQVDAVLKATGNAANVTAGHIDKLASAESKKIGLDDEIIKHGELVLLTFRGVRNEVGKGNDIFDRATKAAEDLSSVMGGDVSGAALLLGKALNDPAAGLTRLTRAGVTFTAAQKEQIKTLTASGHALEAQKIILAEVEQEFGGAAKAAADPIARFHVQVQQLEESVGKALLPVLNKVVDVAGFIGDEFGKLPGSIQATVAVMLGLVALAVPLASLKKSLTELGIIGRASGVEMAAGSAAAVAGTEAEIAAQAALLPARQLAATAAAQDLAAKQATAIAAGEAALATEGETAATAELTAALAAVSVAQANATRANVALAASEEAAAAGAAAQASATGVSALGGIAGIASKLGQAAIVVAAGYVAFRATTAVLTKLSGVKSHNIDNLAAALIHLGKSGGEIKGDLTKDFGPNLDRLAKSFRQASHDGGLFRGGLRQQQQDIKDVDKALANLVKSGHETEALEAQKQLLLSLRKSGLTFDEITKLLPHYNKALEDSTQAENNQRLATDASTDATKQNTHAIHASTVEIAKGTLTIDGWHEALDRLAGVNVREAMGIGPTVQQGLIDSRKAIRDVTQSIKDNGTALNDHSEKGDANVESILQAASTFRQLADAVAESTGSTQKGNDTYADYITQLEDAAVAAGQDRGEIEKLLGSLGLLPAQIKTVINVDNATALANIEAANLALQKITAASGKSTGELFGAGAVTTTTTTSGRRNLRAGGGRVDRGRTYWVGERGAEPFIPDVGGQIVSHDAALAVLRGMGTTSSKNPDVAQMAAAVRALVDRLDVPPIQIVEARSARETAYEVALRQRSERFRRAGV